MTLKTVSILASVFILALIIDCKTLAESETDGQDENDSCQDQEQLSIQNGIKSDRVAFNETISGDFIDPAHLNPSKLTVGSVYPKSDISESDITEDNSVNLTSTAVTCVLNKTFDSIVELVNASKLAVLLQLEQNVTFRYSPATCIAVLFYSPSCPFSCMAAPHFNALQRFFPTIKMVGIDAVKYRNFNAQFGIFGTPTFILFHGGRPVSKFNDTTDYGLGAFAKFITKSTNIQPTGKLVVTSSDFSGPVPSVPVLETDYYLILSWVVIMARVLYSFYYSTWGRSLVDATLNAWREAEAQHHHAE